jgi:hypothetical protein
MENQKSAVEWLAKNLKNFPHVKHSQLFRDLVNQAKEMEKEQIMNAWYDGWIEVGDNSEHYYNKTFKSE